MQDSALLQANPSENQSSSDNNRSDLEQLRMGVLEHLGIAQAPAWLFAAELREGTYSGC
jgi:hypothetical protein